MGGAIKQCTRCTRKHRSQKHVRCHHCRETEKERVNRYRASPRGRAVKLLLSARSRASKKKMRFDLTVEWIEARLSAGVCELSGMPFFFRPGPQTGPHPMAPSLDRIDSNRGYTPDNCRVIVWCLNASISSWGDQLFGKICLKYLQQTHPSLFTHPRKERERGRQTFDQYDLFTSHSVQRGLEQIAHRMAA